MEILYLLIPLSAALVLGLLGLFGWALNSGQFEDLEDEGGRILDETVQAIAENQLTE
jgi:cbb3-type cytochrome oxidase maturation protein